MWGDKTPEGVKGSSDLKRIATVGGQMEALILKSRLEAERIPVHLSYDSAGSVYAFSRTNLGAVHLMVPEAFAEAALNIYHELRATGETPESSTDS